MTKSPISADRSSSPRHARSPASADGVRRTDAGRIDLDVAHRRTVFRVGYAPDPFTWTDWHYADRGRFRGRWDDPDGTYRTLYVGASLLGCLLEVLADFRPDPELADQLDAIVDNDEADTKWPTVPGGTVPTGWLRPRRAGRAQLTGEFVDVRRAYTISSLRRRFGHLVRGLDLPDLDAAALKLTAPRELTQAISRWCYGAIRPPITGIAFASRFGDDIAMAAVFEQPDDGASSSALARTAIIDLDENTPELIEALAIHRLTWR